MAGSDFGVVYSTLGVDSKPVFDAADAGASYTRADAFSQWFTDIFCAERHTNESNFKIETTIPFGQPPEVPVPEPTSLLLLGSGLVGPRQGRAAEEAAAVGLSWPRTIDGAHPAATRAPHSPGGALRGFCGAV